MRIDCSSHLIFFCKELIAAIFQKPKKKARGVNGAKKSHGKKGLVPDKSKVALKKGEGVVTFHGTEVQLLKHDTHMQKIFPPFIYKKNPPKYFLAIFTCRGLKGLKVIELCFKMHAMCVDQRLRELCPDLTCCCNQLVGRQRAQQTDARRNFLPYPLYRR